YTCKITFLKVENVPVADFNDLSCDPYLQVTLSEDPARNPENPQYLTYRTRTCRRTLHPEYNEQWIVSNIPDSGFLLSIKLRDEDPGNYDDNLGKTVLRMPNKGEGKLSVGWKSGDREYKVHKRNGNLMVVAFTWTARAFTRGDIGHNVRLWVSAEVLGKSENQEDTRLYTVGPRKYTRHFSPLIGWLMGSSKSPDSGDRAPGSTVKPTAFVANRIQLAGPVPATLRHRYVGFAPFVKAMFRRRGIRGILLHHALHRQHLSVYKWDKNVVWGVLSSDSLALARQFLKMTSYGTHGRIFTYVIMLDGEWRFTETGEQLAIEFLSKHTMHSDVCVEIAYSGEFFVRPLRRHKHRRPGSNKGGHPTESDPPDDEAKDATPGDVGFDEENPPDDPALYELVIDNDSGTYRPRADLLPTLHSYLASPRNLGALGRVTCIQAFDEHLKKWKDARKQVKKQEGGKAAQPTGSLSSSASSSVSS
ncbi:hypothetical protein BC835DRAFT_1204026, partial [Cytidiella melzeri]